MINYVWIGLLVLAIGYGAWLDGTKVPTTTTPDAKVLADFRSGGRTLTYEFQEGARRAEVAVGTAIDKQPEGSPNRLHLKLMGDGSPHQLQAVFANTAGDLFLADAGQRLKDSETWQTASIDLTSLTVSPENPTAKPSYPLTLVSLAVVRATNAEPSAGTFQLEELRISFPSKSKVASSVESPNWMGVLTKSMTRWTRESIDLAIGLIGIIMFWLGLMRIAEQAGLVQLIARLLRPIMRRLFPEIPPDGEAMGAIVMNVAANMLGLGNAATPLGLKAMAELQKVNENKEYASNAQCMLLAINTSSVTLIAPTIMGYRAAAGSADLMKFWPVMIGATLFSTCCAVLACKVLERLPIFRIPLPPQMKEAGPVLEAPEEKQA